MLGIRNGCFIETVTPSSARILHPAKILGTKDGGYTAEIEEANVSFDVGAEFQVYFELKKKFVKQAAKVTAVHDNELNPTIEFVTGGEPVSAESRQHFRVSTVTSDMTATLGSETDCKLLNVSTVGLAVLATAHHDIGSTVTASVYLEGEAYSGRVCVQSIRSMDKGQIRYGLHCVDGNGSNGTLATGLRQLTMAMQRQQLRRLARA